MSTDRADQLADLHDELRTVARDVLGKTTPLVGDGGPPAPVDWGQLAEMGWLGLEVPEALGGAGATFAEVAVILEELGRATTVSPYLGTVVLAVGALDLTVPGAVRDELLERTGSGAARVATVLADGATDARPVAAFALRSTADGSVLDGRAELIVDAPGADHLLVVATDPQGDPVLVLVDPGTHGITVAAQPLLDATRSFATVVADAVPIAADHVLRFSGDPAASVQALLDRGATAVACDGLGLSKAMLDATVAYAGVRSQFGRPIGSFQAVKHACADLLVQVSVADELVRAAVHDVAAGDPSASVSAAMAKAYVGDAAVSVAGKAMQLHGGIGYAWESGVHVYLKRATLDRALLGSPVHHRRRLAERLVRRAADAAT